MSSAASSSSSASSSDGAGLLLHVDVNGTITAIDSVDTEEPHQLVNMLIAKHAFGHVTLRSEAEGGHEWTHHAESTTADRQPGTHSYYSFAKKVSGMEEIYKFTDEGSPGEHLAHFAEAARAYYPTADNSSAAIGPLFPSFVNALRAYPRAKIVLRTFGYDAPIMVQCIQAELERFSLPQRIFTGYTLLRQSADNGQSNEEFALEPVDAKGTEVVRGDVVALGAFIDSHPHDLYILDNYLHWDSRNRLAEHGKPIFPSRTHTTLLALDDNKCMSLDPTAMQGCAHARFIHVEPLRAMSDDSYFTQAIEAALEETRRICSEASATEAAAGTTTTS